MATAVQFRCLFIAKLVASGRYLSTAFVVSPSIVASRFNGFSFRWKSGDSSSDDAATDGENSAVAEEQKTESKKKAAMSSQLLERILSMQVSENAAQSTDDAAFSLNLARPTGKFREVRKKMQEQYEEEKRLEKQGISKAVVASVKDVASSFGGDKEQIESDLIRKLKDHGAETEVGKMTGMTFNLSDMVTGMKIDRSRAKRDPGPVAMDKDSSVIDQPRTATGGQHQQPPRYTRPFADHGYQLHRRVDSVELFGAPPLNIFTEPSPRETSESQLPKLETWDKLSQREIDILALHSPANGFEEMITWTKQGKLWHFPIDNEQGIEEEAKIGFHEHVFLESHLEHGFPKKGPIRHFMEVVIVGLSKNPYITVQKKKEHIDWFRNYFAEKQAILKDVGALT